MKNTLEIPCVSVTQPIGTFYIACVPATLLLEKTRIERRGLTDTERQNVQRRLNTSRTTEISEYSERVNATFPTSIIVAADGNNLHFDPERSKLIVGKEVDSAKNESSKPVYEPLSDDDWLGLVIDGQHRIEGLRKAGQVKGNDILEKFEMPVVFMFDMSLEDMAEVFRTINSKQRPVDPSLIIDLFGLARKRSPRKTCHSLALGFNDTEGSPLWHGLKMLGKRQNDSEFLSQGSFAKYVLPMISRNPDDDELRLMQGLDPIPDPKAPLREFFIDKQDDLVSRILWNYLSAAKEVFPLEWATEPKDHLLRKTVGFSALMKVFATICPKMLEEGDVSEVAFVQFFTKAKSGLGDRPFANSCFASSEAEAGRMARAILAAASE
jgi:DGQHR domain-containing protein